MNELDMALAAAKHEACYADEQRKRADKSEAELLAVHRKLAYATLRADQGWQRYEEANADRNQLRAALQAQQGKAHVCRHDETIRQGAIWTKCEQCGKRWADDEAKDAPALNTVADGLLPCPFCGNHAVAHTDSDNGINHAGCADTDCIGFRSAYDFTTQELAMQAWNNRHTKPAPATLSDDNDELLKLPLEELLGKYWEIAYSEGKTGESRGTEAQKILSSILELVRQQL